MEVKLSQQDKETIVAEIQAKSATMTQLAERYNVSQSLISNVFKKITGNALHPRPRKDNENQKVGNWSRMSSEDQELALSEVLRLVVKLCQENRESLFVIEINLKDQIVSIRQQA
jgi:transposase-like protein